VRTCGTGVVPDAAELRLHGANGSAWSLKKNHPAFAWHVRLGGLGPPPVQVAGNEVIVTLLRTAFAAAIRCINTAEAYENEVLLGRLQVEADAPPDVHDPRTEEGTWPRSWDPWRTRRRTRSSGLLAAVRSKDIGASAAAPFGGTIPSMALHPLCRKSKKRSREWRSGALSWS
jgi:hypothetical protein